MILKFTCRALAALSAVAIAVSALVSPAAAQDELIFNVFIPRPAPLYKNALEPWAREVEAASNGALKITIPTSSLAPPKQQYDIVQDGVADISVAPLTFKRKQLGLDMLAALPLISETAKGASVARVGDTCCAHGSGGPVERLCAAHFLYARRSCDPVECRTDCFNR